MAEVSEHRMPRWMVRMGPRRTEILFITVIVVAGAGLLVGAIVKAQGSSSFLVAAVAFALGATAVPLLMRLGKTRTWNLPDWAFGAIIGAFPVVAALLPGPAIVALLAMGAGFFLTFAPVHLALHRAHRTEIEARWKSWQD